MIPGCCKAIYRRQVKTSFSVLNLILFCFSRNLEVCPNFAPCYIYTLWCLGGVWIKPLNKRSEINHEDRIERMSRDMSLTTAEWKTGPNISAVFWSTHLLTNQKLRYSRIKAMLFNLTKANMERCEENINM